MRQTTIVSPIIAVLFIITISLPLVSSILSIDEKISSSEKRKLADFPTITLSISSLSNFPSAFDKYIADHFGFRNQIVQLHNYALYKLFKISPTKMVTIGAENWFFFNGNGAIYDYLGKITLSKRKLQQIAALLQDRSYWLNTMGIQYLYLPIPNKEAIYDEYLPTGLRNNKGITIYDQVIDHLKQHSSFNDYLDTQNIMLNRKQGERLFLQTDSHWNHEGVYLIDQQIVKKLQRFFPDLPSLKQHTEKKWVYDFSGDLAIFMNLNGIVTETAPDLNIEEQCVPRELKRMNNIKKISEYRDLPLHRLPVENGCDQQKYKAILIHDSFGKFLRPYLSQQFETIIYINYLNFEDAKTIIEREMPDVVIDQRVARNLLKGLIPDKNLEQMVLEEKFDSLPDLQMFVDYTNWQKSLVNIGGTTVNTVDKSIGISFDRRDSFISFKANISEDSPVPIAVKIDLNNDQSNEISLCYQGLSARNTNQCEKRTLEQGQNILFFRILSPDQKGLIKIKTEKPGHLFINSIAAKKEIHN